MQIQLRLAPIVGVEGEDWDWWDPAEGLDSRPKAVDVSVSV
jgi:hypothetical protein